MSRFIKKNSLKRGYIPGSLIHVGEKRDKVISIDLISL